MKKIIIVLFCLICLVGCSNKKWEADKSELENFVSNLDIEKVSEIYNSYSDKTSKVMEMRNIVDSKLEELINGDIEFIADNIYAIKALCSYGSKTKDKDYSYLIGKTLADYVIENGTDLMKTNSSDGFYAGKENKSTVSDDGLIKKQIFKAYGKDFYILESYSSTSAISNAPVFSIESKIYYKDIFVFDDEDSYYSTPRALESKLKGNKIMALERNDNAFIVRIYSDNSYGCPYVLNLIKSRNEIGTFDW